MRKGFTLIEILVSLFLIISALSLFFISYKEYLKINDKEAQMVHNVVCSFSIMNKVNMEIQEGALQGEGKVGDCCYEYYVRELDKNYKTFLTLKKSKRFILYRVFCKVNKTQFVWDTLYYEK